MNPRYVIHEEIDRYLNDQMGAAERRLFEEQLAANPSVRAEFEAQQIAHQVIIENSLLDLKKQMQRDMNGGSSAPPSSGLNRNYRNLFIGLGLVSVSTLYYFYSNSTKQNTAAVSESSGLQRVELKQENPFATTTPGGNDSINSSTEHNTEVTLITPPNITITQTNVPAAGTEQPKDFKEDKPEATPQHVTAPATTPATHTAEHAVPMTPQPGSAGVPVGSDPATEDEPQPEIRSSAYTFQPEVEGNWTLPYKENTKGIFRIISRSGVTVYQTSFSSGTTEWNGNDAAGTPLPGGYYIYLIEYEQGKAEKGSLTILR